MTRLSKKSLETVQQKIHPIVEFFPVDDDGRNGNEFIDTNYDDRKELRKLLSLSKGLYSFYNSEYEAIYIGKTKSNLWIEMKNAFNRPMGHYERFYVEHPSEQYKAPSEARVRHIKNKKRYIWDTARYFSAYRIEDNELIDIIELMIIRMMPNDLLNVRIEGNGSLQAFVPESS